MDDITIGIIGGGQLMQMLSASAPALGMKVAALTPDGTRSSLGQICKWTLEGSCSDIEAIKELSLISDVLTAEHDNVNYNALADIEREGITALHPFPAILRITQDKYMQKVHAKQLGIAVANYTTISRSSMEHAIDTLGLPLLVKQRRPRQDAGTRAGPPQEHAVGCCDDHGFFLARTAQDVLDAFGHENAVDEDQAKDEDEDEEGLYAEALVPFVKQLAVLVVRTHGGELFSYPTAHTLQLQNSSGPDVEKSGGGVYTWPRAVIAPAQMSPAADTTAQRIAKDIVGSLSGVGVYTVELFLTPDDEVLFHQVVPSVHASGLFTQQACDLSQFEMHLRAIAGLPVRQPTLVVPYSVTLNIMSTGYEPGAASESSHCRAVADSASAVAGTRVQCYPKYPSKAPENTKRILGHINISACTMRELQQRTAKVLEATADSDRQAILGAFFDSADFAPTAPMARVALVMSADCDASCMAEAAAILEEFQVPYSSTVISAHRTPTRMYQFATQAINRGTRCIIVCSGGGGSSALPGMIASLTALPVIGVPIKSGSSSDTVCMSATASSMADMPRGVPVATVGIGAAANAALLAIRILGAQDSVLNDRMYRFMESEEQLVHAQAESVEAQGLSAFLAKTNSSRNPSD